MANAKESESRAADIIRYTIEFLGTWEIIHNPNFKVVEFAHFKSEAGMPQRERLVKLNQIAIQQMRVLGYDGERELLK